MRRWVESGDSVEWFAAGFAGAAPVAELDGIRLVRAGRQWSVHLQAIRRYRGQLRDRFDLVIDEVNTMPFFTPLWARIPSVLLIFQLAREVWWYESPFPLNALGYALEPWYLRAYRATPAFTISQSTADDLRQLNFRGPLTVVPIGIERISVDSFERSTQTTFIYVGRLAPSKRVHDILLAFHRFKRDRPRARLWLVGDGDPSYVGRLRRQAAALGLTPEVEFCGRLDAAKKHRRMALAEALLVTSVREGWGLVVTEAAACGTPAIVYDVPGLRDSVRQEQTGLVVPATPDDLARAMRRLADDPALRAKLGAGAREWSRSFSYDRSARVLKAAIRSQLA